MSVLVTGDWHLNNKPRDRYRHDWQQELRTLIAKYKVHTLIMLGDLTDEFDHHPASLVNDIIDHLTAIKPQPQIYLMRGNHDYVDPSCPFFKFASELENVRWINDPVMLKIEDIGRALFLPHTRDYKVDWANVDFDDADIAFAHNTFAGAVSESGQQLGGVPLAAIPKDLHVISGDVHVPQDVGHVTYVGSPYTIDFGDSFKPRVLLLREGTVKSISCNGPQKRLLAVSADAAQRALAAAGADIVKLRVTIDKTEDWSTIKRQLIEDAVSKGIKLHSIEAVIDAPAVKTKRFKVASKAKRDDEILTAYCSSRGVNKHLADIGLVIVRTKE